MARCRIVFCDEESIPGTDKCPFHDLTVALPCPNCARLEAILKNVRELEEANRFGCEDGWVGRWQKLRRALAACKEKP